MNALFRESIVLSRLCAGLAIAAVLGFLPLLAGCPAPPPADDPGGDPGEPIDGDPDTDPDTDPDPDIDPEGAYGALREVAAKVVLPGGVALDRADLIVSTIAGDAPVAADGAVRPQIMTSSRGLVQVVGPDDKLVLMGFVGQDGNVAEIGVRSTATALIYFSLFGSSLPFERVDDLLSIIEASPATTALAAAVGKAMASSPTAIADGDETLEAAIATAQTVIIDEALRAPAKSGAKRLLQEAYHEFPTESHASKVSLRSSGNSEALILLSPNADLQQSGIQILQNDAGDGIIAMNNFRRRATMYPLLVAVQYDDDMSPEPVVPPVLISSPVEIAGSARLSAFSAAASFVGDVPWAPVRTPPVDLPREADAAKTIYQIVVIGPSLGGVSGSGFSDSRFEPFRADWTAKVNDLQYEMALWDFVVPVVEFLAVGGASNIPVTNRVAALGAFKALIDPELAAAGLAVSLTSKENVRLFLKGILEAAVSRDAEMSAFGKAMLKEMVESNPALVTRSVSLQQMERGLARALSARTVLVAVDLAFGALDLLAVMNDLSRSARDESWEATVVPRRVRLEPSESTLASADSSALLTASVNGLPNGVFLYRWSTTGARGKLFDAFGNEGKSFDSKDKTIQYIPDLASARAGRMDTIKVEVFARGEGDVIPAGAVALGSATAVVNGPLCRTIGEKINIPYAPLRNLIASAVGKPSDQITCADVQQITTLSLAGIVNFGSGFPDPLNGIQYATNLVELNVNFCLLDNPADWDRIRDLTNLRVLDIGRTSIAGNMEALRGLTKLENLNLDSTGVSDLSALANMSQLRVVRFQGASRLTSLDGLQGKPRLRQLVGTASSVVDVSALAGAGELVDLDLRHSRVASLAPLSRLTRLRRLVMGCSESVTNLVALEDKPELEELDLVIRSGRIRDLSPLANSTRLRTLILDGQQILSLEPLTKVTALTNVSMQGSLLISLEGLNASNLVSVSFSGSRLLSNIDALAGLPRFCNVGLNDTAVTSVLPIVQSHMSQGALNVSRTPARLDVENVKILEGRGVVVP